MSTELLSTKPIATAPTDDEERILHLWCPELASWEAGVFFESVARARRPRPRSQAIALAGASSPASRFADELPHQSQRVPDG